jgi:crotonobetainyl-CoA:carnitine CoA-transferase CaiB-like acyl-CoA transferase
LTDLTAQALGGPMLWTGSPHREPLRLGGARLALYQAGAASALALMMALFRQERDGVGDHVDVSVYETQFGSRDRAMPYSSNHLYNGTEPRRQEAGTQLATGIRPCADGFVGLLAGGVRLPHLLRLIGMDELADDPALQARARDPELAGEIEARVHGVALGARETGGRRARAGLPAPGRTGEHDRGPGRGPALP